MMKKFAFGAVVLGAMAAAILAGISQDVQTSGQALAEDKVDVGIIWGD